MQYGGVIVRKDALKDSVRALQALTRRRVLVGIPQDGTERTDGAPINNAQIGYINEFGFPAQNIPARPHLVPGIRKAAPTIIRLMKEAANITMTAGSRGLSPSQRDREIDKALTKVGLVCVASVQEIIKDGLSPALSPVTIMRRQTRKVAPRFGTKPLLDTAQYWQHINFVLDQKGMWEKGVSLGVETLSPSAGNKLKGNGAVNTGQGGQTP